MAEVRAKFKVTGKNETVENTTVKLVPVYGNGDPNHENTQFWQHTPQGSIELGCVNKAAADKLQIGAEYYIDFTKAS